MPAPLLTVLLYLEVEFVLYVERREERAEKLQQILLWNEDSLQSSTPLS
jgi:hypothetical protein